MDFKHGLKDPMNRLSSWKGRNCCSWQGIVCDNATGAVITVDLHNLNEKESWGLSGEIRPALTRLKSLKHLDLNGNAFAGIPIPEFFQSLEKLQYLDLSYAGFGGSVPRSLGNISTLQYLYVSSEYLMLAVDDIKWMTGLTSLKYLSLSGVDLYRIGSEWVAAFGNLPHLTDRHLSSCNLSGSIPSVGFVNFSSLSVINLNYNRFLSEFPNCLVNVSNLVFVAISDCRLYQSIPLGFSELPNLQVLDLKQNFLTASSDQLFNGSWKKIKALDVSNNLVQGKLPATIANMKSLTYLLLFYNNIEGEITGSIGKLCNLKFLSLSYNNLSGSLPQMLEGKDSCLSKRPFPSLQYMMLSYKQIGGKLPYWLSLLTNLVDLSLEFNMFSGSIPASLGKLSHLFALRLNNSQLNGTLPDSLGQLSELYFLDVSSNRLSGLVSELHFSNQSKLKIVRLSSNSFIVNFSSSWVPPFQLWEFSLGSCHLGPSFPAWLRHQRNMGLLDISNCSISDSIPNWFWNISGGLHFLNLSFNQLTGHLPHRLIVAPSASVGLRSNLFQGPIPLPVAGAGVYDLSDNQFSGSIPETIGGELTRSTAFLSLAGSNLVGEIPTSIGALSSVQVIDLSRNNLSGSIPASIGNCSGLKVLDLQNNNLSGEIPVLHGQLRLLIVLHLSNNKITGEIPSSFQNLSYLENLDLGNNRLAGIIPPWIGNLQYLRILRLRSNAFSGEIPSAFSNLSHLQVLDLAENDLNGTVPASFGDLLAIIQEGITNKRLIHGSFSGVYYEESIAVNIKNQSQIYTKTLSLLTCIDLSGNNLQGQLPGEITKLAGLVVLNLSRNHFTGQIPQSISDMHRLSSLDLSDNMLSGSIPSSMSSLSFLGYLDLSWNNFSGRIPYLGHLTTFEAVSFLNNPYLCGPPLAVHCALDNPTGANKNSSDHDKNFDNWLVFSVCLGFAVGILVPYILLATIKSWQICTLVLRTRLLTNCYICMKKVHVSVSVVIDNVPSFQVHPQ